MAHTYTKLTYHATFSTKGRQLLIHDDLCLRLHPYVGSIIDRELGFTREVGGTADHIHILFDLSRRAMVPSPSAHLACPTRGGTSRLRPNTITQ